MTRTPVDHPAVALWVDLLNHIEALVALGREGQPIDLRAMSHLLQDLADAMADHRPVLELLTTVRAPDQSPTPAFRQAVVTVHALAFGSAIDLSQRELLVLGLASTIAALRWGEGPEAAVASMLPLTTLGDLAPEVLEAVHGLSTLASDERADRPAAVLSLLSDYVMLLFGEDGRPPMAPAHALAALGSGSLARVDRRFARRLALSKGAWPVGSLLRLSNDRLCIVVGWAEGEAHGRPVVVPIDEDGQVGPELDLAEMPALQIVEAVSASRAGLDVTALVSGTAVRSRPRAAARVDGAQVSLSYELENRMAQAGPDESGSLEFDLSIDDGTTFDSMEIAPDAAVDTLEWR